MHTPAPRRTHVKYKNAPPRGQRGPAQREDNEGWQKEKACQHTLPIRSFLVACDSGKDREEGGGRTRGAKEEEEEEEEEEEQSLFKADAVNEDPD